MRLLRAAHLLFWTSSSSHSRVGIDLGEIGDFRAWLNGDILADHDPLADIYLISDVVILTDHCRVPDCDTRPDGHIWSYDHV